MAAQAPGPPAQQDVFSDHYKRLQGIEQRVVHAVDVAGRVMGKLSKVEQADKDTLRLLSSAFMQQVQEAQGMVLDAVKGSVAERSFEASVYHPMVKATVAAEKLDVVMLHLEGILKQLRQGQAAAQGAEEAHVAGQLSDGGPLPSQAQQQQQQQQQHQQQPVAGAANGGAATAQHLSAQPQPMES